uniref:Putative secreted protein n=1 Tax=Anopheles marajoara TaxID=58244 RepID=A0A2M4C8W8_9DIPT
MVPLLLSSFSAISTPVGSTAMTVASVSVGTVSVLCSGSDRSNFCEAELYWCTVTSTTLPMRSVCILALSCSVSCKCFISNPLISLANLIIKYSRVSCTTNP